MKQVFLALMCVIFLSGCDSIKALKLLKKGAVQKGSFSNKTPFERIRNLMIVKVIIKEKPYNFIFDTGAAMTVLSEQLVKELGLKPQSKQSVGDSQGKEKKVDLYAIESLNIGNTLFTNEICLASDFTKMSTMGENFDGILGATLMRNAVWHVDNANKTITIADNRNGLPTLENTLKLPFKCEMFGFVPKITIILDGISYPVTFDSGSDNGISLNRKLVLATQKKPLLSYTNYSVGNASMGLYGRGKTDTTYYQKTQKIQLGAANINSEQIMKFRKNTSSLLGMRILKNYNFILDWHTKEILLSQIKEVPKDVLNPWGFNHGFEENSLKITEIFNNSDAAKKGLMLGDVVLKINDKSYQNLSKKEQFNIVLGDLIPTESTEAHLVVQRNKEEIKIDLKK
jgi:uncharacterized protein YceK